MPWQLPKIGTIPSSISQHLPNISSHGTPYKVHWYSFIWHQNQWAQDAVLFLFVFESHRYVLRSFGIQTGGPELRSPLPPSTVSTVAETVALKDHSLAETAPVAPVAPVAEAPSRRVM